MIALSAFRCTVPFHQAAVGAISACTSGSCLPATLALQQCRRALQQVRAQRHASSTSYDRSGPAAGMLSAVPFAISRQEADTAFDAYHGTANTLLTKPAAGVQKVKEVYLPLWVGRAQAHSVLKAAEVGFRKYVQRYNPLTKRIEGTFETQWHWVSPNAVFEQYFSPEMVEMQIVASYHYPLSDISKIRPGPAISSAKPIDRHMMTSSFDGSTRRVSMFEMKAETGRVKAVSAIKNHQYRAAQDFLLRAYRCDETRGLNMDVNLLQFSAAPVLMPVFLYSSKHFGNTKVRTFVAGFDGSKVSGVRVYNETLIGLVTAAFASVLVVASGIWQNYPALQVVGFAVAAPALLVGVLVKYWPKFRSQMHQVSQDASQYMNRKTDESGSFSTSWTHAYSQFARFRQSQEQARFSSANNNTSDRSAGHTSILRDPKGYYQLLEIEPSASKADVQAAFRGLAMKQHPDRFDDPQQKASATVVFRQILEAYTVLRDDRKRQLYDMNQL
ncbi:hypothetical protein ABBQ32_008090 [Trebouxia sp. C0010 RCD-2024]